MTNALAICRQPLAFCRLMKERSNNSRVEARGGAWRNRKEIRKLSKNYCLHLMSSSGLWSKKKLYFFYSVLEGNERARSRQKLTKHPSSQKPVRTLPRGIPHVCSKFVCSRSAKVEPDIVMLVSSANIFA